MRNKYLVAILILIIIILLSVILSDEANKNSSKPAYTIGSPVISATQMPPGMVMKTFNVSADEPVPTISLDINQDSMNGWDVHVDTTNFTFAPEHLDGIAVPGEGHVHLYIDGNLIIMLGPWYHIDSLTPGPHTIRVGLFNNDHSIYSINGVHIEAQKQINVSAPKMTGMSM